MISLKDEVKEILDNFKIYEDRYKKCNEIQFIIFYRDIHLLLDYITNLQEENERLNNIINELEKYLIDKQELTCGCGITRDYLYAYENVFDKLKELKEKIRRKRK